MKKILGIVILMISSILFGLTYYKKYKKRPESIEMYINLLNCYLLELKWKRKSFIEVVKQNRDMNEYINTFASLVDFHTIAESAITHNDKFVNLYLSSSDIEILNNFFKNTGKGNLESEITLCQNTIELLKVNKEDADISKKKMGPLSLKISVILGLWIAIILL